MNQKKEEKAISLVNISSNDEIIEAIEKKEEGNGIELIDEEDETKEDFYNEEDKTKEDFDDEEDDIKEGIEEDETKEDFDDEENEIEEDIDDKKKDKTDKDKTKRKINLKKKKKWIAAGVVVLIIIFSGFGTDFFHNTTNNENNFSVRIKQRKIGDSARYTVNGSLFVSNDNGLYTYSDPSGNYEIKIVDVTLNLKGNADINIEGITEVNNGFQEKHKALKTGVFQKIDFDGKARTDNSVIKEVDLEGDIDTFETLFTDLNTNTTIQSVTKFYLNVTASTGDKRKLKEFIYSYPEPKENTDFDFSEIYLNKTFKKGDKGEETISNATVYWNVIGSENINNNKALKIHITLDTETMAKKGIENFDAFIWIANDYSVPLKIDIKVNGIRKGYDYEISYNANLADYEEGSEEIPYGSCTYGYLETQHFIEIYPNSELESMGEYIPNQGTFSSEFNATDAINKAKKSDKFREYLEKNPDAYVVYGFYNETDSDIWNLTFGEKGKEKGYYVNVTENKIKNEGEVSFLDLDLKVENSKSELGALLTFSSSENIFRINDKISSEIGSDFKGLNFGVRANMQSPKFDITSLFFEATKIKCAYFMEKDDGTFKTAMDAENGRLMFIWSHEGDSISLL